MQTGEWTSTSAAATEELALSLGSALRGGEILLLEGQLGVGKTVFAKGVARAAGIAADDVTSPTFTLVNRYEGRLTLYHLDLYRLQTGRGAALAVDLDELLAEPDTVILIEWAERLGDYSFPATTWRVTLTGDGDDTRSVSIARLE